MHPWGRVELRRDQQHAFMEMERLLATQPVRRPICLVGDFGAGKTTIARYWLAQHFDDPESHYCSIGRPLLDGLKREGDLERLASSPEEAGILLHLELAEVLKRGLEGREALVVDAIELLMPYRVPLLSMLQGQTRGAKVAVICVPDSPDRGFTFQLPAAEHHRLMVGARDPKGSPAG